MATTHLRAQNTSCLKTIGSCFDKPKNDYGCENSSFEKESLRN
jgi:hypothetical protein